MILCLIKEVCNMQEEKSCHFLFVQLSKCVCILKAEVFFGEERMRRLSREFAKWAWFSLVFFILPPPLVGIGALSLPCSHSHFYGLFTVIMQPTCWHPHLMSAGGCPSAVPSVHGDVRTPRAGLTKLFALGALEPFLQSLGDTLQHNSCLFEHTILIYLYTF